MKKTIVDLMLACAGQLLAGGFYLQLGNPEASPSRRKDGRRRHHQGSRLPRSGGGQGDRDRHRHRERPAPYHPAEVKPLCEPGMYALSQQWPKEGKWVIELVARNDEQFTNTLISAGPAGIDRLHAKADMKAFAPSTWTRC